MGALTEKRQYLHCLTPTAHVYFLQPLPFLLFTYFRKGVPNTFYILVIIFAQLAESQSDKKDLNAEIFWEKLALIVFYHHVCSLWRCPRVPGATLLALGIADLGLQGITSLLGVAKQHRSVGLVEDGVVNSCVSHTQGTFHHNHLEWEEIQSHTHTQTHSLGSNWTIRDETIYTVLFWKVNSIKMYFT